ncbi:N-6 DNA methylase [Plastorhodobacter daqingensis]|uniref:site-specific DNA-methyltransferase (adenine-specific) n=1 Tax=Plastorhodobacter daqingensis TaxID=1387281 RepID=A0ABW2URZ5_9RHOB
MDNIEKRKARGAFFTPPEIARYLCDWAVREPTDTVFEPSCGEASFLMAAGERLRALGAAPLFWSEQLQGVEIFDTSARNAEALLQGAGFDARVSVGDFFEHDPPTTYDAIVGNPPFVRYQNFTGAARSRSLEAALAQGVRLSGLASSWAAFVVKAALHVAPGGRLALVLPAELLSVNYAQEVRRFLLRRFGRVRLIMFEDRVFPGVLEEVVLLLADGTGGASCLEVHQTKDVRSLASVDVAEWIQHTPSGDKWTNALVAEEAFATYQGLIDERFELMREWGRPYLGAVTGNNKYFSLSRADAVAHGLTDADLVRISPPGARHLRGLTFTDAVWKQLANEGSRCLLLYPGDNPSAAALRYIEAGADAGVSGAYKCRVRSPWWRVPLVEAPDLFLTYMNHDRPRLVTNAAGAHILNSVYGVRLANGRREVGRDLLPIASLNSITLLGTEVVGRAYGGGLLKMEPREADNLPLPSLARIRASEQQLRNARPQLASALRRGDVASAVETVDRIILADVPEDDLKALRLAREMLFQRRRARGKGVES